jgi:hypothetical protein
MSGLQAEFQAERAAADRTEAKLSRARAQTSRKQADLDVNFQQLRALAESLPPKVRASLTLRCGCSSSPKLRAAWRWAHSPTVDLPRATHSYILYIWVNYKNVYDSGILAPPSKQFCTLLFRAKYIPKQPTHAKILGFPA